MGELQKGIAARIEARLSALDRRPAWLAKKSGVSASQISRILDGTGNPTVETLKLVSDALEMTVTELIGENLPSAEELMALRALKAKVEKLYGTDIFDLMLSPEVADYDRRIVRTTLLNTPPTGSLPVDQSKQTAEVRPLARKKQSGD